MHFITRNFRSLAQEPIVFRLSSANLPMIAENVRNMIRHSRLSYFSDRLFLFVYWFSKQNLFAGFLKKIKRAFRRSRKKKKPVYPKWIHRSRITNRV